VATLNVKSLPDDLYEKLKARARRQHRSVSQEVVHILSRSLAEDPELDVTALRGLGRHVWAGRDAAAHVREERDSWE
jgi:plasmid stability protein